MIKTPVILASQSPRRKTLLEWAEVAFKVVVASTDESFDNNMEAENIPIHIARTKAFAVKNKLIASQEQVENIILLAADTVVVLEKEIINKPSNKAEAISMLQKLSGKAHRVITGVVILLNEKEVAFSETTHVQFHPLTMQQIEYYVDHYQPYDKAGAYAIQEWIGVIGIAAITGDFYNVMGLPVSRVVRELTTLDELVG
ncbi:MAG: septum formation protein Maf [Chitinophaga sp.]|jgi:septum formation protein|nr:septum formation protein Maf [Chitinophaga sp.]PJE47756.1 MAG: septum formation protein Maf [Sediminibacterium sp.] [Sediminibacterium sp. FEMGT703S]